MLAIKRFYLWIKICQCNEWWVSFDPQETWAIHSFYKIYRLSWVDIGRLVSGSRFSPLGWLGRLQRHLVRFGNSSMRFVLIWSWLRLVFSLSGTVLWVRWEPLSPRLYMGDGVKVAGWSVWWWQSHTGLKNCKHQFRGLLWNWRFPSFRSVDWMLWGFLSIFVIKTIIIVVTFVVRTVFLWVYTIQFVELVTMAVKYK